MPKQPKNPQGKKVQTPIDALKWLTVASDQKDSERPILSWAFSDSARGQTVASDMYHMHIVREALAPTRDNGLLELPKSVELWEGATYPDYAKALPDTFELTARVYGHDLKKAIQQARTFEGDSHRIYLVFSAPSSDSLSTLRVVGKNDAGELETGIEVSIDAPSHVQRIDTAFNAQFLLDALRGLYTHTNDVMTLELHHVTEVAWSMRLTSTDSTRQAFLMGMIVPDSHGQDGGHAPEVKTPEAYTPQPIEQYASRCTPRIYPHPTRQALRQLVREAHAVKFVPERKQLMIAGNPWRGQDYGAIVSFGTIEVVIHEFYRHADCPTKHYESHLPALSYERFARSCPHV